MSSNPIQGASGSKMQPSKSSRFVAGNLVTPCFKVVPANLLLILTLEENTTIGCASGIIDVCIGVIFDACMCMHMQESEMSHHSGAAAGYIQLAIEWCV